MPLCSRSEEYKPNLYYFIYYCIIYRIISNLQLIMQNNFHLRENQEN